MCPIWSRGLQKWASSTQHFSFLLLLVCIRRHAEIVSLLECRTLANDGSNRKVWAVEREIPKDLSIRWAMEYPGWFELQAFRRCGEASRRNQNAEEITYRTSMAGKRETQVSCTVGKGDLLQRDDCHSQQSSGEIFSWYFWGQKTSTFDSEDVKFRKESTRRRCEIIRGLCPDGIISWAIAYAPTLWAGGSMSSDVFDCLVDDIEPELVQPWPTVIQETLHKLKEDEETLQKSLEYCEVLSGLTCWSMKQSKNLTGVLVINSPSNQTTKAATTHKVWAHRRRRLYHRSSRCSATQQA